MITHLKLSRSLAELFARLLSGEQESQAPAVFHSRRACQVVFQTSGLVTRLLQRWQAVDMGYPWPVGRQEDSNSDAHELQPERW